jgi:hypothetical protein
MLVELSVMEQRYQAVTFVVHDGESVVEVARRFNVSRQTVHAWLARYGGVVWRRWRTGRIGVGHVRIRGRRIPNGPVLSVTRALA